jgi:hypothetical protein
LVAVTTATEVGVATPSMGAAGGGAGGAGGGELPDGGATDADELLPPQPLSRAKTATNIIAMSSSRPERANKETFDM